MKTIRRSLSIIMLLLALFSLFGCSKNKKYNIFTEFATVSDGIILPRHVEYGQTLNAAMQERNLTEDDITGKNDKYIISEYSADHIPYKIRERISFVSEDHEKYKNQLYRVEYSIEVKKENKEEAFLDFYEQAKAALPKPDEHLNSLEGMKTGKNLVWTDAQGNTLSFSSTESGEDIVFITIALRSGEYVN